MLLHNNSILHEQFEFNNILIRKSIYFSSWNLKIKEVKMFLSFESPSQVLNEMNIGSTEKMRKIEKDINEGWTRGRRNKLGKSRIIDESEYIQCTGVHPRRNYKIIISKCEIRSWNERKKRLKQKVTKKK